MTTRTHSHSTTADVPGQRVTEEIMPASWWMPVPLDYLDRLRHELGLSLIQQDVFLYILRRTWGYRKRADYIALSQFTDGIRGADGTIIDYGCCTKRRETVLAATERLTSLGLIAIVPGRGVRPSHYTVLIDPPAGIQLADGPAAPLDARGAAGYIAVPTSPASGPDGALRVVRLVDTQQNIPRSQKQTCDEERASARMSSPSTKNCTVRTPHDPGDVSITALVMAGLQHTVARRLAERHPPDYIAQAVSYVETGTRQGHIDCPAGYLYRLLDGGMPIPLLTPHPDDHEPRAATKFHHDRLSRPAARQMPANPNARPPRPLPSGVAPVRSTEQDDDWRAVLGELQSLVTPGNFNRWFSRTCMVERRGETLVIGVPEAFDRDWLQHKLYGRVMAAVRSLEAQGALRHTTEHIEYVVAAAEAITAGQLPT